VRYYCRVAILESLGRMRGDDRVDFPIEEHLVQGRRQDAGDSRMPVWQGRSFDLLVAPGLVDAGLDPLDVLRGSSPNWFTREAATVDRCRLSPFGKPTRLPFQVAWFSNVRVSAEIDGGVAEILARERSGIATNERSPCERRAEKRPIDISETSHSRKRVKR
jgi:hypothetical protein